jgi:flagellar motility protein MotE (MotC chaperone)
MKRQSRDLRLLPLLLCASAALFVLKVVGLATTGGYTLASLSTAQAESAPPAAADGAKGRSTAPSEKPTSISPAERAVLERLQDRRRELEQRERELDLRENLIKAAEKRLEARLAELKEMEVRLSAAMQRKDDAEAARLKSLVAMYENMKPRDAAKIFDRLDRRVLIEVATQISPRRMADILAQMSPESAERLTVELATRGKDADASAAVNELPKIEGRPSPQ